MSPKPLRLAWIVCGALLAAHLHTARAETEITGQYGQSLRGAINGFPFLLLRGAHAERGRAHGVLAAREILSSCDTMAAFINASGLLSWEQAVAGLAYFTFPVRFEDELGAMLEGLREALPDPADRRLSSQDREITLNDLKVLQTGEIFELARGGASDRGALPGFWQCSQFSAWGALTPDGETVIGRNWDYPPLFPIANRVLLAVDPAEAELAPSLDAMFFGMIGSGMFTLNEAGAYLSGNDGGIGEGGLFGANPTPAALVMRLAAETARPGSAVLDFVQAIQDRVSLALIFHLSFPMGGAPLDQVRVVEHDPRPAGYGTQVRQPPATLPTSIVLTNHFLLSGSTSSGDSFDRYQSIQQDLEDCAQGGQAVGFTEAREIMDRVSRGSTLYTAVVWPKLRRLMVATSPGSGVSATQGEYHQVDWEELFALQAQPPDEERLSGEPPVDEEPPPPADGGDGAVAGDDQLPSPDEGTDAGTDQAGPDSDSPVGGSCACGNRGGQADDLLLVLAALSFMLRKVHGA